MDETDRQLDEIKRTLATRATWGDFYRAFAVAVCGFSVAFCAVIGVLLWWAR